MEKDDRCNVNDERDMNEEVAICEESESPLQIKKIITLVSDFFKNNPFLAIATPKNTDSPRDPELLRAEYAQRILFLLGFSREEDLPQKVEFLMDKYIRAPEDYGILSEDQKELFSKIIERAQIVFGEGGEESIIMNNEKFLLLVFQKTIDYYYHSCHKVIWEREVKNTHSALLSQNKTLSPCEVFLEEIRNAGGNVFIQKIHSCLRAILREVREKIQLDQEEKKIPRELKTRGDRGSSSVFTECRVNPSKAPEKKTVTEKNMLTAGNITTMTKYILESFFQDGGHGLRRGFSPLSFQRFLKRDISNKLIYRLVQKNLASPYLTELKGSYQYFSGRRKKKNEFFLPQTYVKQEEISFEIKMFLEEQGLFSEED